MRAIAVPALCLLTLAACATGTDNCRTPIGDRAMTPDRVATGPERVGLAVTWGGTLIQASNQQDATELEILAYPLDDCGRPRTDRNPTGRFIALRPGYLETADLRPGRAITASGRILAVREGQIGDARYRLPMLEVSNPKVWPEQRAGSSAGVRPWISIGVGGGSGWGGGGVGVLF